MSSEELVMPIYKENLVGQNKSMDKWNLREEYMFMVLNGNEKNVFYADTENWTRTECVPNNIFMIKYDR